GGGSVTLAWTVAGASSVSINNQSVSPPSGGSVSEQVTVATTFTFTATNFAGTSTATCSVKIGNPPTINSFTATPSTLLPCGGLVTLSWNVTGATGLSI